MAPHVSRTTYHTNGSLFRHKDGVWGLERGEAGRSTSHPKGLESDSSTHMGWLTTTCNSSPRDLMPSSGLGGYLHTCGIHFQHT